MWVKLIGIIISAAIIDNGIEKISDHEILEGIPKILLGIGLATVVLFIIGG